MDDVHVGEFLSERLREGDDSRLAGSVAGRIRVSVLAGDRGDVDHPAVSGLTHISHCFHWSRVARQGSCGGQRLAVFEIGKIPMMISSELFLTSYSQNIVSPEPNEFVRAT